MMGRSDHVVGKGLFQSAEALGLLGLGGARNISRTTRMSSDNASDGGGATFPVEAQCSMRSTARRAYMVPRDASAADKSLAACASLRQTEMFGARATHPQGGIRNNTRSCSSLS